MCIFRKPPEPPPLPEPRPTPPMPERTADAPVTGRKRKETKAKNPLGSNRTGAATARRRLGTSSLRIPLASSGTSSGNLNY